MNPIRDRHQPVGHPPKNPRPKGEFCKRPNLGEVLAPKPHYPCERPTISPTVIVSQIFKGVFQ